MPGNKLKPLHYGETAKLVNATMDKFLLAYSATDSALKHTQTRAELRATVVSELTRSYTFVQSLPMFYDTIAFLEESQSQRHREDQNRWPSFDGTFTAGISTAVNTTENIYDALSALLPLEQVCHPKTGGISRHIALLHNRQFVAFRDAYLQSRSDGTPSVMPLVDLLTTYTDGNSEWLGFKPTYPDKVLVPKRFVDLQGRQILFTMDLEINDLSTEPMVTIEDIELAPDSPLVGCPFTFTPDQMKAFWNVYCTERSRIDRQLKTGQEAVRHVQIVTT